MRPNTTMLERKGKRVHIEPSYFETKKGGMRQCWLVKETGNKWYAFKDALSEAKLYLRK